MVCGGAADGFAPTGNIMLDVLTYTVMQQAPVHPGLFRKRPAPPAGTVIHTRCHRTR